ncbi:PhoH family protein [Segniliparus rotundus DSM 44985]|uniref:PhoH-like protein n=1 Tax=Segniliparus rotundus (strain ATCC BAA-972 / CDC 1076 / CIP 108378 / DSM 44985 / JCM 13578) TaxID=640132 RepID=D6Z7P2_SEGRD|nr:PhoH family protein [Segniliparus rotundus DSM 44985]
MTRDNREPQRDRSDRETELAVRPVLAAIPSGPGETKPVRHRIDVEPKTMLLLLGSMDANLRVLEQVLPVDFHVRGDVLSLTGTAEDVARAENVVRELVELAEKGAALTPETVRQAARLQTVADESPVQVFGHGVLSRNGKTIRPKTLGQKQYVAAIDANTIVFGSGPAGTGKTYLAMAKAVQALESKQVRRIVLTRPVVEAGERLGFLPGTLHQKIDPYLRPLYDALREMMAPETAAKLLETEVIEVLPLAYMRGRTLNDSFIVLDEAQNTTAEQMKMFLTRLGFGSKMVITGDLSQGDLPHGRRSGLAQATGLLRDVDDIAVVNLTNADVVRHRLVAHIVQAYERAASDEEQQRGTARTKGKRP